MSFLQLSVLFLVKNEFDLELENSDVTSKNDSYFEKMLTFKKKKYRSFYVNFIQKL